MNQETHKLYSQACDAWREYGEINRRAWARLGQIQLEFIGLGLESGARQWQILGEVQNPMDLWSAESGLWAEYATRVNEDLRHMFDVLAERRKEVMSCIERHARLPEPAAGPTGPARTAA